MIHCGCRREISPAYVSPDNLSRPPLRSPSEGLSPQQESSVGEANSMSDEEITFNISRQITGMTTGQVRARVDAA